MFEGNDRAHNVYLRMTASKRRAMGWATGSILHYAVADTEHKRKWQQNFGVMKYVISDHRCMALRKCAFIQETPNRKFMNPVVYNKNLLFWWVICWED